MWGRMDQNQRKEVKSEAFNPPLLFVPQFVYNYEMQMNKGGSTLRFVMTVIVVVAFVAGAIYIYKYFSGAKKDIMANDLKIEILKEGTGNGAKQGDTVVVDYVGTLESGAEFDNSYKRGASFPVVIGEGRVIAGWEKGLLGIKVGEKRRLIIPPTMGYGASAIPDGRGGYLIPPNSILIFEIEAHEIRTSGFLP